MRNNIHVLELLFELYNCEGFYKMDYIEEGCHDGWCGINLLERKLVEWNINYMLITIDPLPQHVFQLRRLVK